MRCDQVLDHLVLATDDTEPLDALRRHHLRRCPSCQAEWRALELQRRQLVALSRDTVTVDPDLWADVVAAVEQRLARGRRRVRNTLVTSGGVAAVLAGVAGWSRVSRGRRIAASG